MRAIASTLAPPLGALILLLLCAGPVAAEPTEEQKAAIKSNCRSDYMSYCWSVPRGGSEAAQCLKQNLAELSPGCQQAVKAATATAAAPPSAPAAEAKPAAPPAEQAPRSVPAAAAKAVAPAPEPAPQTQSATAKAAAPATPDQGAPPTGGESGCACACGANPCGRNGAGRRSSQGAERNRGRSACRTARDDCRRPAVLVAAWFHPAGQEADAGAQLPARFQGLLPGCGPGRRACRRLSRGQ